MQISLYVSVNNRIVCIPVSVFSTRRSSVLQICDLDVVFRICSVPISVTSKSALLILRTLAWIRDTAGISIRGIREL